MEIKTSDLWIYNFERFNYWFSQRPLNIKLPLSIFHIRGSRNTKQTSITNEAFLASLLFYLHTQRGQYDVSVCKTAAVRQVLANGTKLIDIQINKKPFIYSAYLCGVYEFNNTIAVKLGFKKDGLIKVSKKIFTRLFVENEFYTQNYGFVDLISCPPVGFDNKFLDFELIVRETSNHKFNLFKRRNIIIPDCIVFVKRAKTLKYAFSDIINFGEIKARFKTFKYSSKKVRRHLSVVKCVRKPYIFKFFVLFSRLVFAACYFNNTSCVLNSNFQLYKRHIILKRVLSFFKIFKLFIKKRYCLVHTVKWYRKFNVLFYKMLRNLKLNLQACMLYKEPKVLALGMYMVDNLDTKIFNVLSFYLKKGLVSFDVPCSNRNFLNLLFSGGHFVVTKYSVLRLRDFFLNRYIKIKHAKRNFNETFLQRKYLTPKIINLRVPLNRSKYYRRVLAYFSLFFFKSKHNLMSQCGAENLGLLSVKRKLNIMMPRRGYYKYRVLVENFLKNYKSIANVLFLRNLKRNIVALNKDSNLTSLESGAIVRRLLKANKRRLDYILCFKHYRRLEKKRKAKIRKLLKMRRMERLRNARFFNKRTLRKRIAYKRKARQRINKLRLR
jgi:hypothetical protein